MIDNQKPAAKPPIEVMRDALKKYERWCEDDRLRQRFASPTKVRDNIFEDVAALLKQVGR